MVAHRHAALRRITAAAGALCFSFVLEAVGCSSPTSTHSSSPSGAGAGSNQTQGNGPPQCGIATGSTPAFYSCNGPADCVAGTICIDNAGDNHFYCKPLCTTTTGDCPIYTGDGTSKPGPGGGGACVVALCSDGTSSGVGVCEPPNSRLPTGYEGSSCCKSGAGPMGGSPQGGGNPQGGGSGPSGTCGAGLTYCQSCNVCLPPGCPYWCAEGNLAGCSSAPSGLTGCTGPIHAGCDCGTGAGGQTGGNPTGGNPTGGTQCHSLTGCVQVKTSGPGTDCTNGLHYDIVNTCGQAAYCRVCAVQNGAVNDNECQAFTVNGSQTGQTFCGTGISNVKYACGWTSDDPNCVRNF